MDDLNSVNRDEEDEADGGDEEMIYDVRMTRNSPMRQRRTTRAASKDESKEPLTRTGPAVDSLISLNSSR